MSPTPVVQSSLRWLRMEFRLHATTPIALALPSQVLGRRRGAPVPEGRIVVFPAALHGALGASLRRATCVRGVPECADCDSSCLYRRIFRPDGRVPSPIRVEAPAFETLPNVLTSESEIEVAVVATGPAITHATRVRDALIEVGERGFGEPGLFGTDLRQRFYVAESRYLPGDFADEMACHRAVIECQSPWLDVPEKPGFAALFVALQARIVTGLDAAYGDGRWRHAEYPKPVEEAVACHWRKRRCETWSTHYDPFRPRCLQAQYATGAVGTLEIEGDLEPFWPLLRLGEALGIGARTPLGFGKYRLRPIAAASPGSLQSHPSSGTVNLREPAKLPGNEEIAVMKQNSAPEAAISGSKSGVR